MELLIKNARIVTCIPTEKDPLGIIEGGGVAIDGGEIAWVGDANAYLPETKRVIDARGRALLPGFVDPHTHLPFAGNRVSEFARRMTGEDYRTIAAEGGGIAATVRATRAASDVELFDSTSKRALAMRALGTTALEVKSGYGLEEDAEARQLRVARRLDSEGIVRTTTTFLGAHAVPPERRDEREAYVDEVVQKMLPRVVKDGLADSIDAYIDDGAFSAEEGRRVLEAGKAAGLKVRAHVGQFADIGGAEVVAALGGRSADHIEHVNPSAMEALARAGVVGVLLPGAWRTLRQTPPDVGALRSAGVSLAVGTDCNPGTSPCIDLALCAALAVRDAGLSAEEAILGITSVAAKAAGLPRCGAIAKGNYADLVLLPDGDPRVLAYALGQARPEQVFFNGKSVDLHAEPSPW